MKKILIFIDWFLPGTKSGGPVRSCANLIDHLGEEYEFLVITRDTDYCETEAYNTVQSNAWNRQENSSSVFYISDKNLNYKFLKGLIASTKFDVAYINGIYSRFFSILPVYLLRNTGKPVLVAARGMLNPQAFSVKPAKKKLYLSLINIAGFYKNVTFHATNEEEAVFIKKSVGKYRKIKVAPNLPRKVKDAGFQQKKKGAVVKFISVARIAKEKGTLTALRALSNVGHTGTIVYDIYGPVYDEDYWRKCKEVIMGLPENIQVSYKGSVEGDEVPALLRNYHFYIMPSEGENFGHGIVEAFTAGCPVLISDKTPWRGLETKNVGWDIPIEDPAQLVSTLGTALAMDESTYQNWSYQTYLFSRKIIDNELIIEANKCLFV